MWRTRHRGPYRFVAIRALTNRPGFRADWLPGNVEPDDVDAEARALLTDPRDRILRVHVWSDREEQYVMSYADTGAREEE